MNASIDMRTAVRFGDPDTHTCRHGLPATHTITWFDGQVDLACDAEANGTIRWRPGPDYAAVTPLH